MLGMVKEDPEHGPHLGGGRKHPESFQRWGGIGIQIDEA